MIGNRFGSFEMGQKSCTVEWHILVQSTVGVQISPGDAMCTSHGFFTSLVQVQCEVFMSHMHCFVVVIEWCHSMEREDLLWSQVQF